METDNLEKRIEKLFPRVPPEAEKDKAKYETAYKAFVEYIKTLFNAITDSGDLTRILKELENVHSLVNATTRTRANEPLTIDGTPLSAGDRIWFSDEELDKLDRAGGRATDAGTNGSGKNGVYTVSDVGSWT